MSESIAPSRSRVRGKWATRKSSEGEQVRVTVWLRLDVAEIFRTVCERRQIDQSDVIRSSIQGFIVQDDDEQNATRSRRLDVVLAKRVFRVLLGSMGPKEVLAEVLKLLPSREVDKILKKFRKES